VSWYTGETAGDPARNSATASIDDSIAVSYGIRANEDGIRSVLQNIAVFAAVSTNQSDPNASAQIGALSQRINLSLDDTSSHQTVQDIQVDLAGAERAMSAAKDRHRQAITMLHDMIQGVEGVSTDEVAAQILTLQTALQASLQTTAILYQTSLVKYL
jgi:flagellar hook-associated protein FlgK